jgi:diguanylate cyclase (GGDEF)-like protein
MSPGLDSIFGNPTYLVAVTAAIVLGAALLLRGRGSRSRQNATAAGNLPEENWELRKTIRQLQGENRNLSNFLVLLPDFTKQLNSHLEKRKIGPMLLQIIEYLFDPEQILILYTARDSEDLVLVASKGTGSDIRPDVLIPPDEGKIGWVGKHQRTMSNADFAAEAQFKGSTEGPLGPYQGRIELCTAMVHDNRTLGIIALGGMKRRPRNEKRMLKMVADLGSIGLSNARQFREQQALANSDGLTHLINKRHFLVRLGDEIFKAEKDNTPLSVFLFDLDHFKNYNDANGHLAGDEALKVTGRLLRQNTREDDIAARYGGEEFIVVLPNTPKEGAFKAAEKIRQALESFPFPNGPSQPLGRVTISGGVASFPMDGRTSTELISAADQALYQAKNRGRNKVCIYRTQFLSEASDDVVYFQRKEL